ncbi:MAG: hypothetical protein BWZ02_01522 [Lentisphaerae bacterium ADurb.BinA184]|nr:MAG: hypothetical protein BWZ02_01522 [Lentisphaerae bacterium ADurb.BinA184]
MSNEAFRRKVAELVAADPRFAKAAYFFVADAVTFTTKKVRDTSPEAGKHISGRQLLDGIREYALEQFGPLALDVLDDWGVRRTEDFGAIVFKMVENQLLGASEDDSPADFVNVYDFREAFIRPFAPTAGPVRPLPKIE